MSVEEIATSGVREKLMVVQPLCKVEGEASPTSVFKMMGLSRQVVESKRNNAKLVDRSKDLFQELEGVQTVKRPAYVNPKEAPVRAKTLEAQVKDADAKYARLVEETDQSQDNLRVHKALLDSSLKAERDFIAQDEKYRVEEVTGNGDVLANQPKAHDAIKRQLRENEDALREVHIELNAVTSGSVRLRLSAIEVEENLSAARAGMALHTSLREESRKKLDAKVARLKEVQSRFDVR